MTVFNGERFLRQAIDSVLAQTFDDWELIVVDDGSNDSTPEILHSYRDPRIKRLREERNRKQAVCSNRALATATGKYIARLDADDVALPSWLAEKVGYMQAHPDVVLLGNAAFDMNEEGAHIGFRPGGLGDFDLKLYLTACNPIIHCSIVFCTDVARELNGYNEDERYWFSEDYDFLSRIAFSGKAIVLPQPLVEVRVHSTSVSARNDEDQAHQGKCITRANLQRALGRDVDERTWSAWWRFVRTEPGRAVEFDAGEVKSLTALISEMIRRVSRERVGRCKVPWLWAKHALALALLPKNHIAAAARARFVLMALTIGIETLVVHR
jgi:glycosyltransferase involved in cell wall biosynthesis